MEGDVREQVEREIRARFAAGSVGEVVLLRHGDDPAIEPGEEWIRVVIDAAGVPDGGEGAAQVFHDSHKTSIKELGRDLRRLAPDVTKIEFVIGEQSFFVASSASGGGAGGLTAVMARLGAVDLETLDTLVAAGIAPNRAEAVRWALARIRERPAYAQLREHRREIEELKTQF